ncbi:MAG TPA: transaldolase [Candidatus Eisenbacteria bacterium]|nr:transaldolase [Candidatus Eisenbacteria bacterium]
MLSELRVKIFADGADAGGIRQLAGSGWIKGFTTNPTLMRAAGVSDYECFARQVLPLAAGRPISFEVFADDFDEMERQARRISAWADNVNVKIPITNTRGESSQPLLCRLAAEGVKVNVTALLTVGQVRVATAALGGGPPSFISVFAGRVADTGVEPVPVMREALEVMAPHPNLELIWASPREILNVVQADAIGCHVITVTHDILKKLPLLGRDLADHSLDTVRMFHRDARSAGYTL